MREPLEGPENFCSSFTKGGRGELGVSSAENKSGA